MKNKKNWPNVFKVGKYFVVDGRRYQKGLRSGKREYFDTEELAFGRVNELRFEGRETGTEVFALGLKDKADAHRALELLAPHNKSLTEACLFFIGHLEKKTNGSELLSEIANQWYESKVKLHKAKKYSDASIKTARYRKNLLIRSFPGKRMHEITPTVFKEWLLPSKYSDHSMAGIKAICSEFFNWAVEAKHIEFNPCSSTRIRHDDKEEVEICKNPQIEALLKAARGTAYAKQAVPYILLGLYAGLRPTEAEHLTWDAMNFETKQIRVKSYSVRYTPMSDDLTIALRHHAGEGEIIGPNWDKNWRAVKRAAGFGSTWKYPHDGLRHTFASMWMARSLAGVPGYEGGRHRLASIMENSPDVIKKHYQRAIPSEEIEGFYCQCRA